MILSVDCVSVAYGKLNAVWDVSLGVSRGEIVTLIGANGAGKTTLLNAIAGLVPVKSGTVYLGEQSITGRKAHQLVKLGIGYVAEGRGMFASMSVLDNLILGAYAQARGLASRLGDTRWLLRGDDFKRRIEHVYELFPRLATRESQKAGSLSGGEQQMLAIGRALMTSPKLLLLDEPSLGLAPTVVKEILGLLSRLRDEGMAVLLVEQDAVSSLKVADRGYVMEMGRIAIEGTAKYLINNDKVRQAYLGQVWAGSSPKEGEESA